MKKLLLITQKNKVMPSYPIIKKVKKSKKKKSTKPSKKITKY